MKKEFLKGKTKQNKRRHSKLEDICNVLGGKENIKYNKNFEFSQKKTQEEWIDLMGIPKK